MSKRNEYRWHVGTAATAIAAPMLKQARIKKSRIKYKKKLFRYYKMAKYGEFHRPTFNP